jgi:hypothetical protein
MAIFGANAAEVQKTVDAAVKVAKDEGAKALQELKGSHQLEVEALKGKNAKEIAELTSQKDVAEFSNKQSQEKIGILEQAKAKGEELLAKTQEKLGNALKPKVAEQELPTGNKLIRKVNKNGAKMTMEVTSEGKKVSCTVETLDGMVKKTTYDPVSGKPVKTFSTSSGKNLETKYDAQGYSKKPEEINVKKAKNEKAYALAPTKKERSGDFVTAEIPYSDGSRVKKTVNINTNETSEELHFKPGSNEIHKEIRYEGDAVRTFTKSKSGGHNSNYKYNNGIVVDEKSTTTELGVKLKTRTARFPKDAETDIKVQKQVYTDQKSYGTLIQEERKLKNGDLVKINVNPNEQTHQGNAEMFHNYKVESIEIKQKNGEVKKLDRDEALKYLQENEPPHTPNEHSYNKVQKHQYV